MTRLMPYNQFLQSSFDIMQKVRSAATSGPDHDSIDLHEIHGLPKIRTVQEVILQTLLPASPYSLYKTEGELKYSLSSEELTHLSSVYRGGDTKVTVGVFFEIK